MKKPIESYKTDRFVVYNQLAYPSWKRLGTDGKPTGYPTGMGDMALEGTDQKGLSVEAVEGVKDVSLLELERRFGVSEKHRALAESFSNSGMVVRAESGRDVVEPVQAVYTLDGKSPMVLDHNVVKTERGSSIAVVFDYLDDTGAGYHNGVTKLYVEAGARMTVYLLQNLKQDSTHIMSTVATVESGGELKFYSIDLGAGTTATDFTAYLDGDGAKCDVNAIYLGDGKRKLDLGYNVYHIGRRTESSILVKGALLDESKKIFRGNLKFERGCKGSKGAEAEYAILLDERVRADAIPALLCDEDDVSGEHAASAGQVSGNQLFYLMSRGLTEKEAKKLIIHASFSPVIDSLPSDSLKERVEGELDRRLVNDIR